ncbi:interferon-stimulated 20 kDa exonuclease-like 2 isoform X2 [Cynoglossus semilaevis]|uniref:Interferon stimulated exonuclease 20 like 2 n=1 Tax=Cynoglossus semilaevis TaxID=244447 RepID=A0A3P8UKA1_CYNSE|nr:interferon-stimulated 20 kDa exonuclease-like 2 isoform X2 [Cynoglossus semilaevis]
MFNHNSRGRSLEETVWINGKKRKKRGGNLKGQQKNHQGAWLSTLDPEVASLQHQPPPKPDTTVTAAPAQASSSFSETVNRKSSKPETPVTLGLNGPISTKILALDCEMVGAGPKGHINQLARCTIVSYEGDVVYDKFIRPALPVTDYRTRWSGIRHCDLIKATPYIQARKEILKLLVGKVVIGHAVQNDFKVLGYGHPGTLTRDTSRCPLINLKAGFTHNQCVSLKRLTKAIFDRDIQTGRKGHSSVEDARASMELYKVVEQEWEKMLVSKPQSTSS